MHILRNVLLVPQIFRKIILEDQLWVVAVAEEVATVDGAHMLVEELEGLFVGELDNVVLQGADAFEELVGHLGV